MASFSKNDYRSIIAKWLEDKQKVNPRFSLGSLARRLGYSSTSSLSNVLSGKRSLSSKHAKVMVELMELPPGPARQFLEMVANEKISRKGFDTEPRYAEAAVFDQKPMLANINLGHFVACSKIGAGLPLAQAEDVARFITEELKVDGRKVFDELLSSGVLVKEEGVIRPSGAKGGVYFSMAGDSDRSRILRSAQELQELTARRYMDEPPRANLHLAVLRVRPEEVEEFRKELIAAIRTVYERFSYGEDLTALVGFQTNFVRLD